MVVLGGGAFSYERGTPLVDEQVDNSPLASYFNGPPKMVKRPGAPSKTMYAIPFPPACWQLVQGYLDHEKQRPLGPYSRNMPLALWRP